MKKWKKIILIGMIVLIFYFLFFKNQFPIVDELPIVMQKEFDVVVDEEMNRFLLEKDGEYVNVAILIDNEKNFYLANSLGHNITKFYVDKNQRLIYIQKNIVDYKAGGKRFQLIKVPYSEYRSVTNNNKIKVYIDKILGYEIREYNLNNSEYEILDYRGSEK